MLTMHSDHNRNQVNDKYPSKIVCNWTGEIISPMKERTDSMDLNLCK